MEHPRKFEEEAEILEEEAEESPNEVRTSVLSDPRTPTTGEPACNSHVLLNWLFLEGKIFHFFFYSQNMHHDG